MHLETIHSTALPLGTVNARLLLGCGFGPTVLLHPAEAVCSSGSEKTQCSVAYSNKMCVRTLQGFRVMIICPNLRSELRYSRAGCFGKPCQLQATYLSSNTSLHHSVIAISPFPVPCSYLFTVLDIVHP